MNITILTYGSRGDVQPFLALAQGLKLAGHSVTLAAPGRFAGFVQPYSIRFVPLAGDPAEISKSINAAGANVVRMLSSMRSTLLGVAPQVVSGVLEASAGADLLVHSFLFTTGGHSLARQLGIPDISIQTFPMFAPTGDYPNVALPSLGRAGNYLSHWLATWIFWHAGNSGFRSIQARLPAAFPRRLAWPFSGPNPRPLLFAISPTLIPHSAGWPANVHITGYFFLDEPGYRPPEELERFLDAGPAPVCVSFGSMLNNQAGRIRQTVQDVLQKRGERVIFLEGWGGRGEPARNSLHLEGASHAWLLPRCKAVIHHGGAGTTAAGLRAGIPAVILPHAADQPFWGARVRALGAGSAPIPVWKLNAGRLAAALDEIEDPRVVLAAQTAGRAIRAEQGLETAIRLIEREKPG